MNSAVRSSHRPLSLLLGLLVLVLVLLQTAQLSQRQALEALQSRAESDLNRYALSVQQKLDRYKDLPRLLATHSNFMEALAQPENPDVIQHTNLYLEQVTRILGASDSYLMDAQGVTQAASNWNRENSFVGLNFGFRPYFRDAMAGKAGHYFALGTTSRQRGYYFSWPVRIGERIAGAIVVKIDLNEVEQDWSDPIIDIAVTDEDGVIVITTRPEWKFHALGGLSSQDLQRIQQSQRYLGQPLEPLELVRHQTLEGGRAERVTLRRTGDQASHPVAQRSEDFLLLTKPVPDTGLNVAVFARTTPVDRAVLQAVVLAGFVCIALLLLVLFIQARWRIVRQRREFEVRELQALQAARDVLETRVEERTADLTRTNARLLEEMEQHQSTQNELVQTAKLAVLGQLAAGINHELNQPLTAIRNYADNAQAFLRLERFDRVGDNLKEIAGLTDRMARIIHPLKEFARKSSGRPMPVSLQAVKDGAMSIMYGRLGQQGVEIVWPAGLSRIHVLGDTLRLEQVLVNLLANAMQAMESCVHKRIEVGLEQQSERIRLSLHDTGPGIEAEDPQQVFEPFYTTKQSGQGLGLGLSISHRIIENLGGHLTAANHPEGGAVFTLELLLAQPAEAGIDGDSQ
ncbi:two-component system C4-dicarboxylate transport sensor histidine kinase DctB [Marinobacterium sp. MBR-111]